MVFNPACDKKIWHADFQISVGKRKFCRIFKPFPVFFCPNFGSKMNPTPKTKRRGKQPKFVPDPITGDPIVGLRYWETRNKYFV